MNDPQSPGSDARTRERRTTAPPPAWMQQRWVRIAGAAAILALIVVAWLATRPPAVDVTTARTGPAIESVYASGVVDFVRQARIAPVVNAAIRTVRVSEGDAVRAGQVLVDLVAGPEEATALQLDAQAAQARSAFGRVDRLYQKGISAKAARDDALQQYQAAAAAARAAHERLRDYRMVAPFAGRILRRDAEPGDMARIGTPLFVLADPKSLRITADIDERDAGRVQEGLEALARSDAFPGQQFPARVTEFTPQGDATARVFRARLSLDPDSALRPGMTVEVNIVLARRDTAVLVPAKAVKDGAVFVLDGDRVRRRPVKTGAEDAETTEIREGVRAGEVVVVDPPATLSNTARVRPRPKR